MVFDIRHVLDTATSAPTRVRVWHARTPTWAAIQLPYRTRQADTARVRAILASQLKRMDPVFRKLK
jgi:hypothetical protein